MSEKLISIVTPCYNEEANVLELIRRVRVITGRLTHYKFEHIFIDNASTDQTVAILREEALKDKSIKVIINSRNFGHIRSPYYGLLQASGDAVISLCADLQDPPELMEEFIAIWEKGNKVVVGVKKNSEEARSMFFIRKCYYSLVSRLSDVNLIKNFTGFGLYDKVIINNLKRYNEPYPYFRGLVMEIGFNPVEVYYTQPKRTRGITKNNFFTLFDIAMLGIVSHTKIPLRIATIGGAFFSLISFFIGVCYLIAKILFWNKFNLGVAPVVIGLFLFTSIQLLFLGIIGEYLGFIFTNDQFGPY